MAHLPIDSHLEACASRIAEGNLVVVAEPGAGKTTRLPVHLAGIGGQSSVVRNVIVLEPRRIAARVAARHISRQLHETVGRTCGYEVRFDRARSEETRLTFMTEGLFVRSLGNPRRLESVDIIIFDEIHERHLDADHALARVRHLQRTVLPSLRVVAMSATMDPAPVAALLDAKIMHVEGRQHPVQLQYRPDTSRPLDRQILRCLQDLVAEKCDGHILTFLPGISDINAAASRCEGFCRGHGIEIHRLHGDLKPEIQERALAPSSTQKLVLSTNIAETSVTIDGVTVVIDSGLAKIARTDASSGAMELRTREISQASAVQRAGRAGRTRPGTCVRLYSEDAFHRRPLRDVPEILRSDLSGLILDLAAAKLDAGALAWLDPPPIDALNDATTLLTSLGAIDDAGITKTGAAIQKIPANPRFGKVLVEAQSRGVGRLAANAIAALQEGVRQRTQATGGVCDALEVFEACRAHNDRRTLAHLRDVSSQLCPRRVNDTKHGEAGERALAESMFLGFKDRIGAVVEHEAHTRRVQFAEGGHASVTQDSVAWEAKFCAAVAIDNRRRGVRQVPTVQSAVVVDPDWILEHLFDDLSERESVVYDEQHDRAIGWRTVALKSLIIERERFEPSQLQRAEALLEVALKRGEGFYDPNGALKHLELRLEFARAHLPSVPDYDDDARRESLSMACAAVKSLADLRKTDLTSYALGVLDMNLHWLDSRLPSSVQLPSGRRLKLQFEPGAPPYIASRLQDFFGMLRGPRVLEDRVPVVLHLLAPNRRAVQVTTDLANFWQAHYPALRRQLMRRYPRHSWPEDPTSATPPPPRQHRTKTKK